MRVIPPAIDPLLPKNTPRPDADVRRTLAAMGLDTGRPLMAQVSRFDYWKDPWGVIDAYREARESVPDVQLALLGVIEAKDDPEAFDVLETVRAHTGGDPDVHLYSDPAEARGAGGRRGAAGRRRRDPEVAAGGLRPDRHRGHVEGLAGDRRQTAAAYARR